MMLTTRERLEAAIEEAILALDLLDGDADLEDGGDLEASCEDEGHDSDSEPDAPDMVPTYAEDQRLVQIIQYAGRPQFWNVG